MKHRFGAVGRQLENCALVLIASVNRGPVKIAAAIQDESSLWCCTVAAAPLLAKIVQHRFSTVGSDFEDSTKAQCFVVTGRRPVQVAVFVHGQSGDRRSPVGSSAERMQHS